MDEVPYDFIRKRLSVVVERTAPSADARRHTMITKGALRNVLEACVDVRTPVDHGAAGTVPIAEVRGPLQERFEAYSEQGYRVLGVAVRDVTDDPIIDKDDEQQMTFIGFLLLEDPPKAGALDAIAELRQLGVALKIITGDNRLVAGRMGRHDGARTTDRADREELRGLSDTALLQRVGEVDIFAETEPNQKERILAALRKAGNVVGYLGDGINDASALHAADVGISVESAVDVAKEAADIVLLERDLGVLAQGVRLGRQTFANTLKYVFITTSANFGNMVSMAGASLFLPFLPLLPKQILLNNFLSDFPSMTIATDSVDREQVDRPRRWDIRFIRELHAGVRAGELGVRLPDVRRAALLAAGDGAGVPDGLVHRVAHDGAVHRARHPDPEAVLPQPARHAAARLDARRGGHDDLSALHAARGAVRIRAAPPTVCPAAARDYRWVSRGE